MADLSSLNPANPADGEAVSQGASRIRDLVTATQTSMDVEHTLAGIHSFINGAPAAKPAASTSGRLFIDTTNQRVELDTGSAWTMLHAASRYYATVGATTLTGAYQTLATSAIDAAADGTLISLFSLTYANTTINGDGMSVQVLQDGILIGPFVQVMPKAQTVGPREMTVSGFAISFPLGAGSHTITLQAVRDFGTGVDVSRGALATFVV